MKTKDIIVCAVFAAIMCIFSVMTIPIGAVPISMSLFGVILASCILGTKRGTVAVGVYVLLGAVGLPVFSGFKGGVGVILGPTGGYIWSYLLTALIIGVLTRSLASSKGMAIAQMVGAGLCGVAVCYFFGTLQFSIVADKTFVQSMSVCVLPFIPFDIAKCVIGASIAYAVRTALGTAD